MNDPKDEWVFWELFTLNFYALTPLVSFGLSSSSETTKQLEILIFQHKVTLAPTIRCHLGSQLPVSGGKFQAVAIELLL